MTGCKILDELRSRNILLDSTSAVELAEHLEAASRRFYIGFDPTADSLHIGSLMPLLATRRLQRAGHRPIVLVGGGTGLIGDPSGRTGERSLNAPDVVAGYTASLKTQIGRFVDFDRGESAAILVDNYEWLSRLEVIPFFRDIGKHFPVTAMLSKESVRSRISRDGDGISYTEFSYMLLQAYDYLEISKRYDATLQIGGSDQWGNITAGIELIRRVAGQKVHGLTLPLVTKSDGSKFGKSEAGTIWLDENKTTPYEMYQFWLGTSDADVARFLAYFTFLSMNEIAELTAEAQRRPELRLAQVALADEVVRVVHGEKALQGARRVTDAFFHGSLEQLTEHELEQATRSAPHHVRRIDEGALTVGEALVESKLAPSRTRAREFVESYSVRVNGAVADQMGNLISPDRALFGRFSVLRRGKKTFHVIEWKR